jgi:hypothetical protein
MAMSAAEVTVRVAELLKDSPLMVAREPITIERVAQIMTIDARQTGRFVVSEEGYWDIAPAFKYKPRIRAANGEPTEEQKAQMWRPARLPAKSAVIGTVSNVELAIRKRLVISFVVGLIGGMGIGAGVVLLSIA